MISKLCLFWALLIFQFKFGCWETWSGDIYPIFHGGYVSSWYGTGVLEKYMYWHIQNIELMDMDLYSNDDLLFTYKSQILNNPNIDEYLTSNNSILVKADSKNGATIWAKEIFDYSFTDSIDIK